ncbi:MAG: tripartite tricarboxylate transporter substrate binding protein [Chitinophagaceae bacterium]|nr:tripartite tricarboxylate transporter substrate binding protein [Rubrivivax sp.]
MKLRTVHLLAAALVTALPATSACAQAYPNKPIRLVVPFAPGGNVDITARTIAPELSNLLGQQVVVDNKPGAGGTIGANEVAKAAPDGYTLLMGSNSTISVAPALYPANPYNPVRDFAPISNLAQVPFVLVVNPGVTATNVRDLTALARDKPGTLSMASAGIGSSNHLVGELFQAQTGVKLNHIPYKGSGQALNDLVAGQVNLLFDQLTSASPNIKAGKLRALAVSSSKRSATLPDVPTFAEAGVANFDFVNVTGLLAPAGTPPDIISRLHAAAVKALESAAVRDRFAVMGVTPVGDRPDQFAAFIRDDFARWSKVVKDGNIKPE